jgi:hypothetical protein
MMNSFQQLIYEHYPRIESSNLPLHMKTVVSKVMYCRTNAMRGRVYSCPQGHISVFFRESCNNRSCPNCQHEKKQEWKTNMKSLVLPHPHYHLVFKLPSFCYPYVTRYYQDFIDILFTSSSKTLEKILKYSDNGNNSFGMVSVLHTAGDEYQLHPHIHTMLSGVGLNKDGNELVRISDQLLSLSDYDSVYLSILKKELHDLYKRKPEIGELFLKQTVALRHQRIFLTTTHKSADTIIEYLGNTIKGNGLNLKELNLEYDSRALIQRKESSCNLDTTEFIRRFMLHILPPKVKSIRYFGLYSSGRRKNLEKAKRLLLKESDSIEMSDNTEITKEECELEERYPIHKYCPVCMSRMELVEEVDEFGVPRIVRLKFGKDPPVEEMFTRLVA